MRKTISLLALLLFTVGLGLARAADGSAVNTARDLCDALLASMKKGAEMNFTARRDFLAPTIKRDIDLSAMTRIVVGLQWRDFTPEEKRDLTAAFSDYSIATYAGRFSSYSGERFEVDPAPTVLPGGDSIVHTKLWTGDGQAVQLDYRMRQTGDRAQIIDVYLNGTISELAARRSEYATTLRQGGAKALINLLNQKTAEAAKSQGPGSS